MSVQDGLEVRVDALLGYLLGVRNEPVTMSTKETPGRVARMLVEMTRGYEQDPANLLEVQFPANGFDEMVVVSGVRFASLCEHHMLPFIGTATVGYIPNGGVVGLSKLARLVQVYARRFQLQERMTVQITAALDMFVQPLGSACVLRAHHQCMGIRGIRQPEAETVTSSLTGVFRDKPEARAEFLALARGA